MFIYGLVTGGKGIMRILLAEDEVTLGELTEHQLKRQYHVVDWMKDGLQATQQEGLDNSEGCDSVAGHD
ncbi:response regulator [Paenibacillus roseipurpureus]|uniref:Response regulator n=1 Tax=Paenibacillus roseopurpureus TaxID=2918901 RepID=A0AA96LP13_9BACL|nr:response regulator [Paenibacillus sp. MBLB1832]WNR45300.1 response regulator [Paenibacillus sp. MBLB1832]